MESSMLCRDYITCFMWFYVLSLLWLYHDHASILHVLPTSTWIVFLCNPDELPSPYQCEYALLFVLPFEAVNGTTGSTI